MKKEKGFTLIEILIALFIFTILAVMMMTGLRTVINMQGGVASNSEKLHELQTSLLLLSNDIEQAIDRPIKNAFGANENAFVGAANGFTLTRMGLANPMGNVARSVMQRVRYLGGSALIRATWEVLDQAPPSQPLSRPLLKDLNQVSFQYLAANGRFYNTWPVSELTNQTLPRAVRIFISFPEWGTMSQLYVISAQPNTNKPPESPPQS